jgi:hypothetical protein
MVQEPYIYPDGRMDAKNASLYTGLAVKTLAQLRYQGKGPRFVKPTGGKVFYYREDLDAWLNRFGKVSSTAEALLMNS